MAVITREITLDVSRANVFHAVIAKQHDANSRFLKATIADLGVKIPVPMGAMVMLNTTRPDKQKRAFLGEVNADGTVTVPLTTWLLELDGKAMCDISIVAEDGTRLTTMKFILEIEPASCMNSDVMEDENYDLLVSLLSEVIEFQEAEAIRQEHEDARIAAEELREEQETKRTRAEAMRSDSERKRVRIEEEREQAEEKRVAAEIKRVRFEDDRCHNENHRISDEKAREEAEAAREAAEEIRAQNEETRISNEEHRVSVEAQRAESEAARNAAEVERLRKEEQRASNETKRAEAEQAREAAEEIRARHEQDRHYGLGGVEHYLGLASPFTVEGGFAERVVVPQGASRYAKIRKIGGYTHRYHYDTDGNISDEANAVRISTLKDQNGRVLLSIPDVNGLVGLGNDAAYANYIFFDGGKAYFRQACRLAPYVDGSIPSPKAGETLREVYAGDACVIELAYPIVSDITDLFGEDPSGLLDLEGVTELSFGIAGLAHPKNRTEVSDGVLGYYDANSPFGKGLFELMLESGSDGMRISQDLNLKAQLMTYCEQIVQDRIKQADTDIKRYGVCFDGASNTGETVERLYDAVGLAAGVGTDTTAPLNDFDNVFPWNARRRCCGAWDADGHFVVNAYSGEPGYAEDGTNGEVWVEHSLFYFKHEYEGTKERIVISATPLAGYAPAPIFQKNGNRDAPYQKAYTPAFPMATVDGVATSRADAFPGIYSLGSGMAAARTLGERYTTTTAAEQYTECLYMWVEFATRHLQDVMKGATTMPHAESNTATVAETDANRIIVSNHVASQFTLGQTIGIGTTLGMVNIASNRIVTAIKAYDDENTAIEFDGDAVDIEVGNIVFSLAWRNGTCNCVIASSGSPISNTDGLHNCIYRGHETPYGNTFEWISDLLLKREGEGTDESPYTYDVYFLSDPTKYKNGLLTADYVKLNYRIPSVDGYVKTLGVDSRFPWVRMPASVGANSSTYYSDYYYYPRSTVCAAFVGGYWRSGGAAGPCYWYCHYDPSYSRIHSSARLSYHRDN